MALEAMVFQQDPFGYGCEELIYSMAGGDRAYWGYDHVGLQEQDKGVLGILETDDVSDLNMIRETWDTSSPSHGKEWDLNYSSPETEKREAHPPPPPAAAGRRKRRRTKSSKNKEELENQRMTHIAVERNRRKQMNEYLAVLRSLMPSSYVQRGDQASIVGGAINFVKELEQLLQTMEAQNRSNNKKSDSSSTTNMSAPPFARFFGFPQYTTRCNGSPSPSSSGSSVNNNNGEARQWAMSAAEIEVTMVETHAHLKILSKKHPKQLLKMVAAFQSLSLTVLHLNVTTTTDRMVLYSVSVKVGEGSQVNTVDEIACAVNEMLWRIQEEASHLIIT